MTFEVSADDAAELSRQFDGHFTPAELTGLRQYEIVLKVPKRKGNPPYPLKAYTFGLDGAGYGPARRDNIIAQSRRMFGRPRERVERIVARMI
jgi:hypothetical protein